MNDKPIILFVCARPSQFPELIHVACLIQDSRFTPIFIFDTTRYSYSKEINSCLNLGILYLNLELKTFNSRENLPIENFDKQVVVKEQPSIKGVFKKYLTSIVSKSTYERLKEIKLNIIKVKHFNTVRKNVQLTKRILTTFNPVLIIAPYEGVGYFYDPLIPLALRKQINTIIIPFCFVKQSSTANFFLNMEKTFFRSNYSMNPIINKLIGLLFPKWVIEYNNVKILRSSPYSILAYHWYKIDKAFPWIDNYGFARKLAVESNNMAESLRREGVPAGTYEIIGSILQDKMFGLLINREEERKKLSAEIAIETGDSKLVVLSLPDDAGVATCPNSKFTDFNEIIEVMLTPFIDNSNCRIVINLHPCFPIEKTNLIERIGLKISGRPVSELLPLADFYITAPSAAIRYAIACGVPVVEYDVYAFEDNYYNKAGGVIRVAEKENYFSIVSQLINNSAYFNEIKRRQESCAQEWGKLDGRAGDRLMALIESLAK